MTAGIVMKKGEEGEGKGEFANSPYPLQDGIDFSPPTLVHLE